MRKLLDLTLSAGGSPSDVKARITDQVKALAEGSADQTAALAAARSYIEAALTGISEDDTLAVTASITISVTDAPPTVVAKKIAAATAAAVASVTETAGA